VSAIKDWKCHKLFWREGLVAAMFSRQLIYPCQKASCSTGSNNQCGVCHVPCKEYGLGVNFVILGIYIIIPVNNMRKDDS
jgi:hypothetical protein